MAFFNFAGAMASMVALNSLFKSSTKSSQEDGRIGGVHTLNKICSNFRGKIAFLNNAFSVTLCYGQQGSRKYTGDQIKQHQQ